MMRSSLTLVAAGCALALVGCEKKAAPAAAAPAAAPAAATPTVATPAAPTGAAPAAAPGGGGMAGGGMAGLPKVRIACAADIQKFCAGSTEKPGKCLRPHMAEVSAQCSQAIAARRAARLARRNAAGGGQGAEE